MIILSHRGYWKEAPEKNSETAFHRSFELGFGTETDVRDCAGSLVISHDPPCGGEMSLRDFLALHASYPGSLPLALNIKADGLQQALLAELAPYPELDYFVFDMSVPDQLQYARAGARYFARVSEYEAWDCLPQDAAGVWLDAFHGEWYALIDLARALVMRRVCIVSPDLHRRPFEPHWVALKAQQLHREPNLLLCTDYPEQAQEFFYGPD